MIKHRTSEVLNHTIVAAKDTSFFLNMVAKDNFLKDQKSENKIVVYDGLSVAYSLPLHLHANARDKSKIDMAPVWELYD